MISYAYSYLKSAVAILGMYNGDVPLAIHLKSYFKMNKKYGSKDRKHIAHLCYGYFRTGNLFKKETIENRIIKSLFLCTSGSFPMLEELDAVLNSQTTLSFPEKLRLLDIENADPVFPLSDFWSAGIDKQAFLANQLQQPFLYIRIRPKYLAKVLIQLKTITVHYKIIDPYTIQLPNGFKVEEHFETDREVVIQDYASQMVFTNLLPLLQRKQHFKVWDCCAASGGKSILLYDLYDGKVDLFVTDIRTTILDNLEKRFYTAGIKNYKIAEADIARKALPLQDLFDLIICDVPCSGSGTWARTPEQVGFFKQKNIAEFAAVQYSIAFHAAKNLKQHGFLIYITCSVFADENEKVVQALSKTNDLELVHSGIINGYTQHADTMYVAILQKKLMV